MLSINAETVHQALTFPKLVNALEIAFTESIEVPPRLHFDMENPTASRETTLLMMPAWQAGDVAGIKLVTVAPENSQKNLPSIQGTYILLDVDTGSMKAMMDAPSLTAKRTAAASALASRYLSRENSQTLLVVGTGTLAPQLIAAHASVRPITQVYVWGRDINKAQQVCHQVEDLNVTCTAVDDLKAYVNKADIISCATLSTEPLIFGKWLQDGQHLDMVGAYRPDMREMDDACLTRSKVFVDNFESAVRETGDIAIPLAEKVIEIADINADLFSLCRKSFEFKRNANDITVFKSVGHALEDLAAAKLVFDFVEER
ncbi:ornithine cyclodeaminase family protein [Colwellia sp. 1_MG-2023]|uniref:ornithine cyclodeaminase family protein n=1 Tax=Colwellia sp. 1_MG-2023 TaxID=3062649 RepID=UPI0026E32F6B|nr:ornithine cyclodeaminase family protein [Colwellia sp. 1_MG-2023]MDO6446647.1 ornithine cyclodeaminase family protein [Colwellia sp. 1_MG-2023]